MGNGPKAVTIKDVLDPKGKYYDPYGRTRKFAGNQWSNCCTFSDCRAGYQWCKKPGVLAVKKNKFEVNFDFDGEQVWVDYKVNEWQRETALST